MINWDMIENILKRSRPNFTGQFRVAIYSRMPYGDGQEATAENHIKFMKLVLDREPRFRVEGVYSEFGVPFTDLPAMQEYRHIIALIPQCRGIGVSAVSTFHKLTS